jgi:uncharacterized protein
MEIAIVTGASAGLGKEFAKQIDQKFNVDEIWLIARREEKLIELSKELKTKSIPIKADLTKDIETIRKKLQEQKPNIKLLVNNAGFGKGGKFHKLSLEEQLSMIDLNIKALVELTYESIKYMQPGSKIIQVASMAGYFAIPGSAIYAATKSFVLSFSNALNCELKGITSTAVCPGPVDTEFFDVSGGKYKPKKMAKAKDVVALALKHTEKNKWVSIYGTSMKGARVLSRLVSKKSACKLINKLR